MKDILYAILRETADAWLGQWYIPREDYEWLQERLARREDQLIGEAKTQNKLRQERENWQRIGAQHSEHREVLRALLIQYRDTKRINPLALTDALEKTRHYEREPH